MPKTAIAISGGVDSAVAALKLRDAGHEVVGLFMLLHEDNPELAAAQSVCERLGIEFRAVDLRDEFDREIKHSFAVSYDNGETPNPCVECNKKIKFGALLDYALSIGCTKIATGHYARCDGNSISKALYAQKDQSYVLWQLSHEQIEHVVFPLGAMTKPEVKAIAEQNGLLRPDKKESMDICFIPDGDYRAFLNKYTGTEPTPGFFTDTSGHILGKHCGHRCYTVGQRRGLGVAYEHPLYVLSKDAASNSVILGTDGELYKTEVLIDRCNWQSDVGNRFDAYVKLRFRAKDALAHIAIDGTSATLTFAEPQRAPSKGQSAVVYDETGRLLGGGIIL